MYAGGLSTFFSSKEPIIEEQLAGKTVNKTQLGAMMEELGVHMIHVRSSQANGRIERERGMFQCRLETEFAIQWITTIEEANAFFPEFVKVRNARFGVNPSKDESGFMLKSEHTILDRLIMLHKKKASYHSHGMVRCLLSRT